MRTERIGFDNDHDRACDRFNGVRFVRVKDTSHAGVDVDAHRGIKYRDGDAAVHAEECGDVIDRGCGDGAALLQMQATDMHVAGAVSEREKAGGGGIKGI